MAAQLRLRVYTLNMLRDTARALVDKHVVDRQQLIHVLCRFVSKSGWKRIEVELEEDEFLMRDRIIDLLAKETWEED
ncbi:MAG: DUF4327 family protein [Phormidesmis sp.]